MLLLSSAGFFKKQSFGNTIRVSKGLDPDQDRHFVGPDLGPNCLQRSKHLTVSLGRLSGGP